MASEAVSGYARVPALGVTLCAAQALAVGLIMTALHFRGLIGLDLALLVTTVPVAAGAGLIAARQSLPGRRLPLLPTALALNLLGLIVLADIAPGFARLQSIWSVLGISAYLVLLAAGSSLARTRRWQEVLFLVSLALVALTFPFGTNPSGIGPRQWLALGPLYFEPSELLKLSLAFLLAHRLTASSESTGLRRPLLAVGISLFLLILQGDLGAVLTVAGIGALVILLASGRWQHATVGLGLALLVSGGIYALVPRARSRTQAWLKPWEQPFGSSYQVLQSWRAITSGGLIGRGLAPEDPTHIPAAHTDMILPVIAERFGLWGSMATLSLYALLLRQTHLVARRSASDLTSLISSGTAALIVGQAVLIGAGSTGLLPLTGVTFPLVSYGGSSLLTSYVALAILDGPLAYVTTPEGTSQPTRLARRQRRVSLGLGASLALLALWLAIWHTAGEAILERLLIA